MAGLGHPHRLVELRRSSASTSPIGLRHCLPIRLADNTLFEIVRRTVRGSIPKYSATSEMDMYARVTGLRASAMATFGGRTWHEIPPCAVRGRARRRAESRFDAWHSRRTPPSTMLQILASSDHRRCSASMSGPVRWLWIEADVHDEVIPQRVGDVEKARDRDRVVGYVVRRI
jgi:hypothetical protein